MFVYVYVSVSVCVRARVCVFVYGYVSVYLCTCVYVCVVFSEPFICLHYSIHQAPPAVPAAPTVVAINATAVSVSWSAPSPLNGVLRTYSVDRNGTTICCVDLATSLTDTGV